MLLAVLERRSGFRMGTQDVFLNLAGGLKVDDTSIDLAICTSIVSSMEDVPISQDICFAAEIGLGGELRGVPRIDGRISEAEKLGFKRALIPAANKPKSGLSDMEIIAPSRVEQALEIFEY